MADKPATTPEVSVTNRTDGRVRKARTHGRFDTMLHAFVLGERLLCFEGSASTQVTLKNISETTPTLLKATNYIVTRSIVSHDYFAPHVRKFANDLPIRTNINVRWWHV